MEETETVWTLADFGALLRERRIHKGLAEEDVAAQLKITSRLVKAIEEGDMEAMPHAVYARGFIRAYAKLLAVDDSITHAACALLRDPEEELREQEVRVVPTAARREERHVREGHGIFGTAFPDFPPIRQVRKKWTRRRCLLRLSPKRFLLWPRRLPFLQGRLRTRRFLRHQRNRLFWVERPCLLKRRCQQRKRRLRLQGTVCC